jgi:hypothetical protein
MMSVWCAHFVVIAAISEVWPSEVRLFKSSD